MARIVFGLAREKSTTGAYSLLLNDYETEGDILDLVALDADGEVVVAVEAERSNNDRYTSVPDDFDKMAACEPDHALWVVMHRDGAHDVLNALNNPTDGEPRVEKTYASGTPSSQFTIDTEGLTEIATISRVQTAIEDGESLW
ncbi:hypothetical protein [Halococcus hamelinensis]|uniref:Uncharacterized protein n=1 Tax=Halococcus hamelinensis 100A6 TaxID=1132509 RepID=M0LXR3_9EURY|nr:hypothetical protein [Halococcus hamelinensis]EMA36890.1 hypothetical protein C447_13532 [Halococcus hamelinensis 100A6]